MSITEEPYYLKHDCLPMCNHKEECVRCHNPHCIKYMYHSRLHGYTCICGSQEWKPIFGFSKQGSGLTMRAADAQYLCARCGHPRSEHPSKKCAAFAIERR